MSLITAVNTANAPQAIGPYSQAVRAGGFVYTAGAIPLTPAGELVGGGPTPDVRLQTRQCLANLRAVLEASGTSLAGVVKTTVFLKVLCSFCVLKASVGLMRKVESTLGRWLCKINKPSNDTRT